MYYIFGKNKEGDDILINLENVSCIIKPKDRNYIMFTYEGREIYFDYENEEELNSHFENIKTLVEEKWKL